MFKNNPRIGLIGNQNNNFFALCRYLRDAGFNATLHPMGYEGKQPHFQCRADSFTEEFIDYTEVFPWGYGFSVAATSQDDIRKLCSRFDYIIGCGLAPAYLARIERGVDLFMPHGGDIHTIPTCRPFSISRDFFRSQYYRLTGMRYWQRKGIKLAKNTSFEDFMPESIEMLKEVDIKNNFYVGFPMVYIPEYGSSKIDKQGESTDRVTLVKKLRASSDLLISWPCRLIAGGRPGEFTKGQHYGLEAIKEMCDRYPERKIRLILFEYGPDVEKAKAVIAGYGLDQHVQWMPLLPRKEIMQLNSMVDLVVGEVGPGWFAYGVVWEALALGKPLVTWVDCAKGISEENVYPHLSAKDCNELIDVFERALHSRDSITDVGQRGYEWICDFYKRSVGLIGEAIEKRMASAEEDPFDVYRNNGASSVFDIMK